MTTFRYSSPSSECPVCRSKTNDCRTSAGGLIFCRGCTSSYDYAPGFRHVGQDRHGVFTMWAPVEDDYSFDATGDTPARQAKPKKQVPQPHPVYNKFNSIRLGAGKPDERFAREFADLLGLPISVSDHVRVWTDCDEHWEEKPRGYGFAIPEYHYDADHVFRVVSFAMRYPDMAKRTYGDPACPTKRGLTFLDGWDKGGDVYVVEGASDCLALNAMGLSVIGRPSSRGGHDVFSRWWSNNQGVFAGRSIVVMGENDEKTNARGQWQWEGRDGADEFAAKIRELIDTTPVKRLQFPAGHKDGRDWLKANWTDGVDPKTLAPKFLAELAEAPEKKQAGHYGDAAARAVAMAAVTAAVIGPACSEGVAEESIFDAGTRLLRDAIMAQAAARKAELRAQQEGKAAEVIRACRGDQRTHHCDNCVRLSGYSSETYAPSIIDRRCEKWYCPGCKGYLVFRYWLSASLRWATASQLHEFGCDAEDWTRVSKRLGRAKARYWRVRDGEGWWVVCDRPIVACPKSNKGTVPISHFDALATLDTLLQAENESRPASASQGWGLIDPDTSASMVIAGRCRATDEQLQALAAEFGATYRYRLNSDRGTIMGTGHFVGPAWDATTGPALADRMVTAGPPLPDVRFVWKRLAPAPERIPTTLAEVYNIAADVAP